MGLEVSAGFGARARRATAQRSDSVLDPSSNDEPAKARPLYCEDQHQ